MDEAKFEIIKQLMEQLEGEMRPDAGEFAERLGREKPDVAIMSVEGGDGMEGDMGEGEMLEMDPKDELKERILKMRG